MSDFIERSKAIQAIYWNVMECNNIEMAESVLKDVPSVDAVEVVRCKDCVYCKRFNDVWYSPKRDELLCTLYVEKYHTTENDFCSWGERKCM